MPNGKMKNKPGPRRLIRRPSRKTTPLSYSLAILMVDVAMLIATSANSDRTTIQKYDTGSDMGGPLDGGRLWRESFREHDPCPGPNAGWPTEGRSLRTSPPAPPPAPL